MASPKSSHFRHATSGLEGSRVQPLRDEGLSLGPATAWEITRGSTAGKDHAEGTRKRRASDVDGSSTRMATKGGTKLIPKISMAPIRAQRNSKRTRTKVERTEDFLAKDRTFGGRTGKEQSPSGSALAIRWRPRDEVSLPSSLLSLVVVRPKGV